MKSRALAVAEAAVVIGTDARSVIQAIEAGTLKAIRQPDGSYAIEAQELERRRSDWNLPMGELRRAGDRKSKSDAFHF